REVAHPGSECCVELEVLEHPNIADGGLSKYSHLLPIGRRHTPSYLASSLAPERLDVTAQVDVEQRSACSRLAGSQEAFPICRPVQRIESAPSFDLDVLSPAFPYGQDLDMTLWLSGLLNGQQLAVRRKA